LTHTAGSLRDRGRVRRSDEKGPAGSPARTAGAPGFAAASGAVRARRPGEARPSPLSRPLRSGCPSLCGGSARARRSRESWRRSAI